MTEQILDLPTSEDEKQVLPCDRYCFIRIISMQHNETLSAEKTCLEYRMSMV